MRKTKKTKFINNEKGITLIALVITIIVLLILAGATISMLTGDNGLLNQAANAKRDTERAATEEAVRVAVLGAMANDKGKVNESDLKKALTAEFGSNGYNLSEKTNSGWTLTVGDKEWLIDENGNVKDLSDMSEIDKLPEIKAGEYATTKSRYVDSNKKVAIIPQGFTVSNVDSEETINGGLVIYKGDLSEVTDMSTKQTTNDQFVWVPVDDPSSMYGTKENGDYWGKLYEFKGDGTVSHLNWYSEIEATVDKLTQAQSEYDAQFNPMFNEMETMWDSTEEGQGPEAVKAMLLEMGISIESKDQIEQALIDVLALMGRKRPSTKEELKDFEWEAGNREPDLLGMFDNNTTFNDGLFTKQTLQSDFREMIESVKSYNGFYIGRYETSLNDNGNVQLVENGTAVKSDTWYESYKLEKEYSENNGIIDSVESSMIWGSQYDQMLLWLKENDISWTEDAYQLNNIFGLKNALCENTIEAFAGESRVIRGSETMLNEYSNNPVVREQYGDFGGGNDGLKTDRMTLYVK